MPETLETFLERVYSYDLKRFFVFSKKLNPYRCSSFGYYVTSPNELTCKLCHSVIILTLDDMKDFSIPEMKNKVSYYLNLMKSSHKPECYFHDLKESEYFKITRQLFDLEWENFYSENLLSYKDSDQEKIRLPILDPLVETFLPQNYWDIFLEDQSKPLNFDVTKILSIFGWKLLETNENGESKLLFCRFCGRKLKICLFATKASNLQSFEENNEGNLMNPIEEHRAFCKWGKRDKNNIKIYGWNICLNYVFQKQTENPKYKGILDKTSQITKIKYEILKGVDELKNYKTSMLEKYDELEGKIIDNKIIENYKDKLKERRQTFEEIFKECGEKLEAIIKKYKI